MELTQAFDGPRLNTRPRSLKGDIARAWLAVVLGVLGAVVLEPFLRPNWLAVLIVLFVAPVAFVLILTGYRAPAKSLAIARSVGASAGWLLFVGAVSGVWVTVYQYGGSFAVLLVFPLLIATMVASSIVVTDWLWLFWQKTKSVMKKPDL